MQRFHRERFCWEAGYWRGSAMSINHNPTKEDLIMSRYRPIAPKPPIQTQDVDKNFTGMQIDTSVEILQHQIVAGSLKLQKHKRKRVPASNFMHLNYFKRSRSRSDVKSCNLVQQRMALLPNKYAAADQSQMESTRNSSSSCGNSRPCSPTLGTSVDAICRSKSFTADIDIQNTCTYSIKDFTTSSISPLPLCTTSPPKTSENIQVCGKIGHDHLRCDPSCLFPLVIMYPGQDIRTNKEAYAGNISPPIDNMISKDHPVTLPLLPDQPFRSIACNTERSYSSSSMLVCQGETNKSCDVDDADDLTELRLCSGLTNDR